MNLAEGAGGVFEGFMNHAIQGFGFAIVYKVKTGNYMSQYGPSSTIPSPSNDTPHPVKTLNAELHSKVTCLEASLLLGGWGRGVTIRGGPKP